ncbi:MAG: ABC transporter permease [Thermodesulfobacteriota bacterium]
MKEAVALILSGNPELFGIVWVSLVVSLSSTFFAALAGVPAGFFLAFARFTGKRTLESALTALLALPTVVVGLFVYAFLSRRGVFGSLDLLYSKSAMVIGQTILVFPVVTVFTLAAARAVDDRFRQTALTLGAGRFAAALAVAREARLGVLAAVLAAFGRVIAEVGVSMMLGGNIKGFTRTMTTAMALEYDKGEFVLALGLGVVLLAIAFFTTFTLQFLQHKKRA